MHKIFVPIYRYFNSHKALMYVILAVTSLVFLFFGMKVKYEEDISKLLPSSSVESQLAFGSIQLKDKIYIQVTSAEEMQSPQALCEKWMSLSTCSMSGTHRPISSPMSCIRWSLR